MQRTSQAIAEVAVTKQHIASKCSTRYGGRPPQSMRVFLLRPLLPQCKPRCSAPCEPNADSTASASIVRVWSTMRKPLLHQHGVCLHCSATVCHMSYCMVAHLYPGLVLNPGCVSDLPEICTNHHVCCAVTRSAQPSKLPKSNSRNAAKAGVEIHNSCLMEHHWCDGCRSW